MRLRFGPLDQPHDELALWLLRALAVGAVGRLLVRGRPLAAESVGVGVTVGTLFGGTSSLVVSLGYTLARVAPTARTPLATAIGAYGLYKRLCGQSWGRLGRLLIVTSSTAIAVQVVEAALGRRSGTQRTHSQTLTVLVINRDSGSSGLSRRAVRAITHGSSGRLEVILTQGEDLSVALQAARSRVAGGGRVVVGGGDGTVGAAIALMAHTPNILGVLPVGTGNDLARSIGVPLYPEEAALVAYGNLTCRIDILRTDVGLAAHAVNIGLVADFAQRVRDVRGWRRPFVYPFLAFRAWRRHRPLELEIRTNDESKVGEPQQYLNVAVLNAPRIGGRIGVTLPKVSPNDGVAQLVTISRSAGRVVIGELVSSIRQGIRPTPRHAMVAEVTRVTVEAHQPFVVSLDGEPRGSTARLAIDVIAGACRIAVPKARAK